MKPKYEQLSKFFSKILRHSPDEFGIDLDDNDSCSLEQFCEVVRTHFHTPVTDEEIAYVLLFSTWNGYHRYQVSRGRVRATYRHTYYDKQETTNVPV